MSRLSPDPVILDAAAVADGSRRVAARVSKDAERQVRGGHPWVFDTSIRSVTGGSEPGGATGDLAVVFDDRRRFVAIGLYDPASPIRIRVLHRGRPLPIDDEFWRERVGAALDRRVEHMSAATTGWRLVHGENDGLGGLVVDRYDSTLVVKLYSAAWFPHLAAVLGALTDEVAARGVEVERVVLRWSRQVAAGAVPEGLTEGSVVAGAALEGPVRFREHGLWFEADVVAGQKTGHFLDQRDNRSQVASLAGRRRVLDVFCHSGGFSVHAAAGGAREVTSVDASSWALAAAVRHMEMNADHGGVARCAHRVEEGDAATVMERLAAAGERFDLVVVDPPSFAHRASDRAGALRAYRRLADLGVELTADRGWYVQSSCSSRVGAEDLRETVRAAIDDAGRDRELRLHTGHAVDHPVGFPQGEYLSTTFWRLEPRSSRP